MQRANIILDRIEELYAEYHEEMFKYRKKQSPFARMFGSLTVSSGEPAEETLHGKFFINVSQMTVELEELLTKARDEEPELCQAVAAKAVNLLLIKDYNVFDVAETVTYSGLEKCAVPLLEFLSPDELERQYSIYRTHRTRLMGKEVIKAMKSAIRLYNDRGLF